MMKKEIYFWIILSTFSFLFASWLMFHTFSYDGKSSSMLIAPKAWSDFGAHIPLIRSFSLGNNWPPQSPLFPGVPIRYHFLFYFLVGMLEKAGLRIDWALNIPSIIGFAGLLVLIAIVAKRLFNRWSVAVLSIVLFLFNGSLSFIRFFQKHPLSFHSLPDIIFNSAFPSFGPWDGKLVSAFWNLNIYTNQRHLAFSFALVLLGIVLISGKRTTVNHLSFQSIGIAFIMVVLLFTNQAAALIVLIWFAWIFILKKEARIPLVFAACISLPYLLILTSITEPSGSIKFNPGYLILKPLTIPMFLTFWWQNLGFSMVTIPLGLLVAPKKVRNLFIIPLLILFIAPNIWRFSPDMINNHKFFNFFLIMGNMLTAYLLVRLFECGRSVHNSDIFADKDGYVKKILNVFCRLLTCICLFLLTLSGFIDLFPIINDRAGPLLDIPNNKDAVFFLKHTDARDIILNSTWFYHPASLAGRKIFSGFSYFTWSYGYNQGSREQIQKRIFAAPNINEACQLLKANDIRFIELSDRPEQYLTINRLLFTQSFIRVYRNNQSGISVYDVIASCQKL